jgi:hypothetical protein
MGFGQFNQNTREGLPRRGQVITGVTGTMAAALTAGSTVWAFRYPAAASGVLYVSRIHQHYCCIGSFTTPVTAGRRLHLLRGSGGDPAGSSPLDVERKNSSDTVETLVSGRIANTGGVTVTGITYETPVKRRLLVAHAGNAGASYDEEWRFDGSSAEPLYLQPGQLLGSVAGATFDAAGTWQLNLSIDAIELVP